MKIRYSIALALVLSLAAHAANAQSTLFWSGNGTTLGGNGTWNTSNSTWGSLVSGPYSTAWNNGNLDTARFGGGIATPTVTLGTNITVGGLWFDTTGYTIANGANTLSFNGTTSNIIFNNVAAGRVTGQVGGNGSVTLSTTNPATAGTLTFNGTSTGGWTGSTTINAGMNLTTTTVSGQINQVLNNTSAITINGGTIQFNRALNAALNAISDNATITVNAGGTFGVTSGDAGGASANETIGSVTLNAGQMNFNWTNTPSSGAQIILSGLSRSGTAAAAFSGLHTAAGGRWRVTGAGNTTAGQIIGPWYTTGGANAGLASTDYAIYSSDFIAPANIAASAESTWGNSTFAYTLANANGSAANGRLTATRNIVALRNTTAAGGTISSNTTTDFVTMAGSTFTDGDVIVLGSNNTPLAAGVPYYVRDAGGAGAGTFKLAATSGGTAIDITTNSGGTLTGGITLPSGFNLETTGILNGSAAVLAIGGSGGVITLPTTTSDNLYVNAGAGNIAIDAPINNNGAGVLTLVKNGSNTLTLSSTTGNFTGGVVLNAGTLATTADGNFGSGGGIVVNGSATWNAGTNVSLVYNRSLTINDGAVLTITSGNAGKTITGNFSGNGTITNTSTTGFTFSNAGNTFTGTVNNGYQMDFASLGDSSNSVNLVGSNSIFNWTGGAKTFALRPFTIQGTGTGVIQNNGSGALTIQQDLAISGTAGARTLTLQGTNTAANLFSGNIANGAAGGTSVVTVTKAQAGNWTISGNMSHTGGLNINGGTLTLAGTNTYSGQTSFGAGGTMLVFAGTQAVSPNTTFVMNTNVSTSDSSAKLLDDTGGVNNSTVSVPNTFTIQNSNAPGNAHTFIVGNNNTANGGTSSGTTTGSTIAFGTLNWNTYAAGTTAYGPINIQGTNGYRLQINSVVLHNAANLTSPTVGQTTFNPTTANVTFGTVTVGTGNTGQGYQTLVMDGTSSDNRITGNISNASDFGTSNRELRVTKSNTSTWTLSGNNTYTGVTTINGGTLSVSTIGNGGVVGNLGNATNAAANLVLGGGTLQYTGVTASTDRAFTLTNGTTSTFDITTNNLTISGASAVTTGALTKIGNGTLTLSGTNGYTGLTTVSAGTLAYGVNDALSSGNVTVSGGTLDIGTFTDTVGAVTLVSGAINGTSGVLTGTSYAVQSGSASAVLAGSGGLTKTTGGTVTLTGTNTYTGVTTINAGTLSVATIGDGSVAGNLGNATSAAANLVLGGTGTLQYTGATASTNRAFTLTAGQTGTFDITTNDLTISGVSATTTGALTKIGNGTLILSGNNTYTGATTVNGGTLRAGAAVTQAFGNNSTVTLANTAGVVLDLNNFDQNIGLLAGGGLTGGNVTLGSGNLTIRAAGTATYAGIISGSGTVTRSGSSGNQTLSGNNTYTGLTTVLGGGTLTLSGDNSLASGGVTLDGVTANTRLNIGSATALGNGTFTISGGTNGSFDNSSGGSLTLTTNNAQAWNSNFTFVGTNNLNLGTGAVTMSATRTVTTTAGTLTVGGSIAGSGFGLTKAGGATSVLALTGNSSYSGVTTISAGTLEVAILNNGGTNSSMGNSTNAAANLLLGNATTFRYVGSANVTTDRGITINGSVAGQGATIDSSGTGTLSFNNTVAMAYGTAAQTRTLTLTGNNTGANTFGKSVNNNTSAATSLVKSGTGRWIMSASGNMTGTTTVNAGTLHFATTGSLYNNTPASWTAANINVKSGGTLGFNLGGSGEFSTGNMTTIFTNLAASSSATNGMNAGSRFAFDTTNASGGNFTISNIIADSTGASGGNRGVTKLGTNTLIFTGNNSYTGSTNVNAGTLRVNGSLAAGSVVTVLAGATLGGNGTVGGPTTIFGIHDPGNSPGVQTFGSDLTYSGGNSSINWEQIGNTTTNTGNTTFDQIIVGGNLDFAGATGLNLTFNGAGSGVLWANTFWSSNQSWTLHTVTGTTTNFSNLLLNGNSTVWLDSGSNTLLSARPSASFNVSQSGQNVLINYIAVPEPTTLAIVACGTIAGVVALHRRRRRRKLA